MRDVADWFISKNLDHKIGTIYALLNSLYREDLYMYALLLQKLIGRFTFDKYLIVYYSALIVNQYCPELFRNENLDIKNLNRESYDRLLELLF